MSSTPEADWVKRVKLEPGHSLNMSAQQAAILRLLNESDRRLAFKLRTTRMNDVKPSMISGVLEANGGKAAIKVKYYPQPNERPFHRLDRLTVVMEEIPADIKNVDDFWANPPVKEAQMQRFILKLTGPSAQQGQQQPKPQSADEPEDEQEESSDIESTPDTSETGL